MRKAKDRRTPIWITEIGWSSERANHRLMVGPKKQASRLRNAFRMLVKNRRKYRIERILWYTWRDYPEQHCRWCNTAGLYGLDGTPKPALAEFKRFALD